MIDRALSLARLIAAILIVLVFEDPGIFAEDKPRSDVPLGQGSLSGLEELFQSAQRSVVKLYGAGGMRGLESYQSGVVIGDGNTILTSWSTVLDVDKVRVVTYDGRRLDAEVVGVDPECELALLRVENSKLPGFVLEASYQVRPGQRVFSITNLFGIAAGNEACSYQKGVVMAVSDLQSKYTGLRSVYRGKVIVVDVMTNNPGAAGGALVDLGGRLVGVIGKELRDEQSGIWLNYSIPADVAAASVDRILAGKTRSAGASLTMAKNPHKALDLGMVLIPNVIPKTPVYIDRIRKDSLANRAGIQANDLVLLVNDQRVDSQKSFEQILQTIERGDSFQLLLQRGTELLRVQIRP
ncbi:MAG: trypsin-like peptidase domain-containing protein [Planctomycetota bacterium]|jgi:serine protease Do|nr:trypsin-like peptidase domain-containing protein [Planctomycetota bacterium]